MEFPRFVTRRPRRYSGRVPFELIDHTEDLAVRLSAPDLAGLIREGVAALRAILFEAAPPSSVPPGPEREERIELRALDAEDALVQSLSEALHALQEGELVPHVVEVDLSERGAGLEVALVLRGRDAAASGLRRCEEIKAVTYHGVQVRPAPGGLEARIVLDV